MRIKCPCEKCICLPTCRHKRFVSMVLECSIMNHHLFDHNITSDEYWKRLRKTFKVLGPPRWSLETRKSTSVVAKRDPLNER